VSEETGAVRGRISNAGTFKPQPNDSRYGPHWPVGCERSEKDSVVSDFGPSGPIQLKQRVEVLEFDPGIFGCELPIGFGVMAIALVLPGGNFLDECLLVRDAAIKAL
jgi:hypothetical protein